MRQELSPGIVSPSCVAMCNLSRFHGRWNNWSGSKAAEGWLSWRKHPRSSEPNVTTMTNSPGAEIVVSSGLPRARVSPPPPVQQTPNIEEPMPDAAESHHKNEQPRQDEASKRSFKRK